MASPKNTMQDLAVKAARRLDEARRAGEQLSLLPDEPGRTPVEVGLDRRPGRPPGATNKGSSQMRDYLAARGMRMPEEVLAEMAGLATSDDALTAAMVSAERVLAWAMADATDDNGNDRHATPEQRLSLFAQLYAAQLRAADALMPYGAAKAAPDVAVQQNVQVVMPAAPADPADRARDVTPRARSRMIPADARREIEQKQSLSDGQIDGTDATERTQEASD